MSKNAKKLVQCPQCEKSFTVKNIGAHVTAVHLKIRHHHCSDCDYQCSTSNALKAHYNSIHKEGQQRPHECDACEKQFTTSHNLKHHIRNIHIINCQEFKCDDCEYVTNNVQNLKPHKDTTHRRINCPVCDRAFNKNSLSNHLKNIHGNESQREFCNICGKVLKHLKVHMEKIHQSGDNIHKCELCSYSTNTRLRLIYHIKALHTLVRDFKCSNCDYKSYSKGKLSEHQKSVHDKVKNQKCSQCDYACYGSHNMENHMKAVHL